MPPIDQAALERLAESIPNEVRGPGGAIGVVKDGRTVLRHVWGYADPKRHLPMTASIRFPICSISKQFTCGVLIGLGRDLDSFEPAVRDWLPNLETPRPGVRELCNNQSGLRDYWALTVLHGADAEGVFRREDARPLLARMRSTHFAPGSRYSYSNGNYRLLSDLIEDAAGRPLAELYRERIFDAAGMATAELLPDTATPADGMVGHEGNDAVGFFPATNRIYWTGDAGISASLDDMLAWERFIDGTRDDEDGLYRRLSRPQTFSDGRPAPYGYGLAHDTIGTVATTGHAGALRGFRAQRLHAASERLSVVVLFNHEGPAGETATRLMKAALGVPAETAAGAAADPAWNGRYLDPETGLLLTLSANPAGVSAVFAGAPEQLAVTRADGAASAAMTLARRGDAVDYERWRENLRGTATRVTGTARPDIAGRYHSAELDAAFRVVDTGGALYGHFEGFLGKGEMAPLYPVADDLWVLPCRRSMDAPAPGDWTVRIARNGDGSVGGLTLGCWLARNVGYVRMGA
ncbi:D-aminopeptidase [Shinella pollutisoli]|uniref:D-aminopeptidase n=1 Tax=Shinella pollutisoli TaxID=2250594 RepID=A0ABV7DNC5_9HYPH|nr:D-aminopeptidase [Shinella pollutisoli]